jgi:hypothetical protein
MCEHLGYPHLGVRVIDHFLDRDDPQELIETLGRKVAFYETDIEDSSRFPEIPQMGHAMGVVLVFTHGTGVLCASLVYSEADLDSYRKEK